MTLHRYNILHWLWVRPRLIISILVGLALFYILPDSLRTATRAVIGWDSAILVYLTLAGWVIVTADNAQLRRNAAAQDEGSLFLLILTTAASIFSVAAIVAELATAKNMHGRELAVHIGLSGATVFLSWCFMHTLYALHYAHEYYVKGRDDNFGGLDFPGTDAPDYLDFLYFSFILGTSAQTADVSISSRMIRRTASFHCVLAFFYNTSILALCINIGAGLLGG